MTCSYILLEIETGDIVLVCIGWWSGLIPDCIVKKVQKGKDVDLYSAFHTPSTPNAHTSLKLTRQTAI